MLNIFIKSYFEKLSQYSTVVVVGVFTFIVIVLSVPLVYLLVTLFYAEYTSTILVISIIAPVLMVPPTLIMVLKLSKHLKFFKDELANEIQKNKNKDMMLFDQARFVLMGEMMANISHQWKQPLNTASLAIVALRVTNSNEDEKEKYLNIMEDNIRHLASTIDDFLSFFDKKTYLELRDLDSVIKEIRSIIYTHISNKNIELVILNDASYGKVKISSSISQVILNMLNNAKDAFEGMNTTKRIKLQFISKKDALEIECCDNARGMSDEIKEKIFDPYFSTKPKTQGTGIGLYMSKEIIQKVFNGVINLSSREHSRGVLSLNDKSETTCFYITIPYSKNCLIEEK